MTTLPIDVQCTHRVPSRLESRRRMQTVLAITAGVMIAEAIGGWLAHSLALLADAGHMLADVAAIGLSLAVAYLAQRPATAERTFGLLRLEILAALVNGAVLIVISLGIALEAYHRFRTPPAVHGALLVVVAAIGLTANAAGTAILHRGHDHSLNQRGAYLHIFSDLLGSLGAPAARVNIPGPRRGAGGPGPFPLSLGPKPGRTCGGPPPPQPLARGTLPSSGARGDP